MLRRWLTVFQPLLCLVFYCEATLVSPADAAPSNANADPFVFLLAVADARCGLFESVQGFLFSGRPKRPVNLRVDHPKWTRDFLKNPLSLV